MVTTSPLRLPEDAYGRAKRQMFVEAIIRQAGPRTVLDFGCGTGAQLTYPIALSFPQVSFFGVDSDETTIAWAREHAAAPNLSYATQDSSPDRPFDLVIVSEVLEHVEAPDQLLRHLASKLADGGRLIVTIPNGHGPFETMSFIEHLLTLCGLLPLVRGIKRRIFGAPRLAGAQMLTLAVSPHVNFFSLPAMKSLLQEAGFEIRGLRPCTFLCGFLIERAIRGPLIGWNARVADGLPMWCASDWMFDCVKIGMPAASSAWRRTAWGRFRRYLSLRRWAGVQLTYQ
jgi:SAM-dependent methyltransferase